MKSPHGEEFSVLRFLLKRDVDGRASQDMEDCGVFDSVESAFMAARLHAMQMWRRLWDERNVSRVQKPVEIELLDTEWGYDLRVEFKVVARFWVHDRTRIDPLGVRASNDAGAER